MSRGARWVLGGFAICFTAIFLLSEANAPSKSPVVADVFLAFLVLIAIACFSSALRGPAVRLIGAVVFVTTVVYLAVEVTQYPHGHHDGTNRSWFNAIHAFIAFGVPGLIVALHGKYPRWGRAASAFRGDRSDDEE